MNSADIRKARDGLIDYINNMPFPMEVKRHIVNEVKGIVDVTANKEIKLQLQKEKEGAETDGKST